MKNTMVILALCFILVLTGSVSAQTLELNFDMPVSMLVPGALFSLDLEADNPGAAMPGSTLFVALNIGTDDYWFYPSWAQFPPNVDSAMVDIAADSTDTWSILPEFPWPDGTGTFSGAMFLAAVIHSNALVSNLAQVNFGWTEMPETFTEMSCNSDWLEGSIDGASETAGFQFEGTAGETYYLWWDDLSSGSETATADITVSAFHEDKMTPYFNNIDLGMPEPQEIVIAEGESSVYLMVNAHHGAVGDYRIGVTFFPYPPDVSVNARQASAWMTGDFDSLEQSQQQPAYYNITLRMKRIWRQRADGYWLYIEQAMSGSLPYRQRVYQVHMDSETQVASEVYEFLNTADEDAAVGAWAEDEPLAELSPDDFEYRGGCAVFLARTDPETFTGGTDGKGCESSLNGASYATSEVTLTDVQMRSWDRGYNSEDEQVWGAIAGPYIFDKKENFDSELDL